MYEVHRICIMISYGPLSFSRPVCFHITGRRTDKGLWETNIVVALVTVENMFSIWRTRYEIYKRPEAIE